MTPNDFTDRLRALQNRARHISEARYRRARRLCQESGLDPALLGIHPHNAMIDYCAGRPWRGIDYRKVCACIRIMDLPSPNAIVDTWHMRNVRK